MQVYFEAQAQGLLKKIVLCLCQTRVSAAADRPARRRGSAHA